MKTIEEIKHQVAVENGYKNWFSLTNHCWQNHLFKLIHDSEDEAIHLYAKQCCDEQRIACAANATANFNAEIDKESILSTPNVAEKP